MTGSKLKPVIFVLWGLVAIAVLGLVWTTMGRDQGSSAVADTIGKGDYELVTSDGTAFTEESLKGTPSAVFFGFTYCPDICPTTIADVAKWQEVMEEEGHDLQAFFVTVDPERDTQEAMRDYVSWAPGVTGVTGSPEAVQEAIDDFRIYARKVELDGGGYTMDHSSAVLLFDENGTLFEPVGYGEGIERATDKLRRLFAS
ncbi:SCO family protein [Palleronia sp. LCG004]|uniref:SCO family protein n=1 Tax=Palleronia sp. LCG004 TaxID=3079304 RepID=UPI002942795B|nr:SCO family protein [Palleronia sp. LCG004]WOI55527.1 SCO family protein [Palleronia sp. LCG004]